jgi:hypothetical protein
MRKSSPLLSLCLRCAVLGLFACPGDGGVGDGWVVDCGLCNAISSFVTGKPFVPRDLADLHSHVVVCSKHGADVLPEDDGG